MRKVGEVGRCTGCSFSYTHRANEALEREVAVVRPIHGSPVSVYVDFASGKFWLLFFLSSLAR